MSKIIAIVKGLRKSIQYFYKSSFLSILVILLILLILFKMEQAYTMMILMLVGDKISLLLCFFFVNALALTLSHYPIYTYYSKGLNKSKGAFNWEAKKVYLIKTAKFKLYYPFFIFTKKKDNTDYKFSITANVLRYALGIFIYAMWVIFIFKSVHPNLMYNDSLGISTVTIAWIIGLFFTFPFIIYAILKYRIYKGLCKNEERLYTRLTLYFFIAAISSTILLSYILLSDTIFSRYGLILVMLCTYAMMFCYVFFRLIRNQASNVYDHLGKKNRLRVFIKLISFFENSFNYLKLFISFFFIALAFIIYWNIATWGGYDLGANVIPILLAYLLAYYWIIANIGKYFFVAKRTNVTDEKGIEKGDRKYSHTLTYRLSFVAISLVFILAISSFLFAEQRTHEIEMVSKDSNNESLVDEDEFIKDIKNIEGDYVFFVSSYGGGLKANAWTLNVLQKIQEETDYQFLNKTISLSGASGGSLGLAVYTGLYAVDGKNPQKTRKKIDIISLDNYASGDLAFTLGLDFYRKVWPLTYGLGLQDRSYYSMIKYQNHIEDKQRSSFLDTISYRAYWAKAYRKEDNRYFPSLIMNTAGIGGNRGILWSIKDNGSFHNIFPNTDNLSDLNNGKTLPYYQAVSMTNRFPGLSPAAKIKGYGHYMDAGVIDNSGLLGNLDVYNYLKTKDSLFYCKKVVFVDIINSKSLYLDHILKNFIKQEAFDIHTKDEAEKDNIAVNLATALKYDKIPRYLGDFFENWESKPFSLTDSLEGKVLYRPVYLPHKISLKDVEQHLTGKYKKPQRAKIEKFFNTYNDKILSRTGTDTTQFFQKWNYYEPTLSRHMDSISYSYMKLMTEENEYIQQIINDLKKNTTQN